MMLLVPVGAPKLNIWQMGPPNSELIEFQTLKKLVGVYPPCVIWNIDLKSRGKPEF